MIENKTQIPQLLETAVMPSLTHGSLFSGIGGFDLAAEWMGWENVFHCEWNENNKKILKKNFPKSIGYDNIKTTDFSIHRGKIGIITGGFPCQPYSLAGKRKGKDDERHLWPEMLRAIREVQPGWVVGENVFGLINWSGGLVFDEVQADLEAEGYKVQPYVLPACAVNAPHRRDRVWFIAYNDSFRQNGCISEYEINTNERRKYALNDIEPIILHSNDTEQQGKCIIEKRERKSNGSDSRDYGRTVWRSGISESPICRKDDGVSRKLDEARLFALGNAIVPQVALQIFKAVDMYNASLSEA
jgi:DNA (cytosine-5)-methyltransferase 1